MTSDKNKPMPPELIENCAACGKQTEDHEWLDGIAPQGKILGMKVQCVKRFRCSKCAHEMSASVLK